LNAPATGTVDPFALAAGMRRVPMDLVSLRVLNDPGLDGDSVGACSRRSYGTTDVTSEHSFAAGCAAVARRLKPNDVERDTGFEPATFSLGS
jgi:hypothetical protein